MQISELKQPVYLFPFTAEAVLIHHILKNHGIKTAGFLDNKSSLYNECYDGIPFMSPAMANNMAAGATVILCGYRYYEHLSPLLTAGFQDVIKLEDLLDRDSVNSALGEIDTAGFRRLAPRQRFRLDRLWFDIATTILPDNARSADALILNSAELSITSRCTLKCEHCCNLMQYYRNPAHFDPKDVARDLELLFSKFDFVRELTLIGGEPLSHPGLGDIINYALQYSNHYGTFRIVTNGTICPSKELAALIKSANIFIKISDYDKLSRNKQELVSLLESHNIPHQIESVPWSMMQQLRDRVNDDSLTVFQACFPRIICNMVMKGKLYLCPFLAFAEDLNAIPYSPDNHIDLNDSSTTANTIRDYLERTIPPQGCGYCTGTSSELSQVPAAKQTAAPLQYTMFNV